MVELVPSRPAPGENWWTDDPALAALLAARLPAAVLKEAEPRLLALGAAAPATIDALAREADRDRPRLEGARPHDVRFHPSYDHLRRAAREHEVFTLAWRPFAGAARAPRVLGFALGYLYAQAECGYFCPACMTDGAAYVLSKRGGALRDRWVPRLVAKDVEGAAEGAMYLTERGGGKLDLHKEHPLGVAGIAFLGRVVLQLLK